MNHIKHLLSTLALVCSSFVATADNWPGFRGVDAVGVSSEDGIPNKWSTEQNIAWKVKVPGRAWSSPIVWGDRVIVTTAVTDGQVESPKRGLYFGGERKEPHKHIYRWEVHCYSLKDGTLLWKQLAREAKPQSPIHLKNTYASETPVTDGKYIVASFGSAGLYCYDMQGRPQWQKDLGVFKMLYSWGTASSPVIYGDTVYVQCDNEEQSFLVALDKATGKQKWRVDRTCTSSWSTPYVWVNKKRTELITCAKEGVRSYDPATGKQLWQLRGMSKFVITMPSAGNGMLYVNSGYVGDKVKPIYAIKPGGKGDITLGKNMTSNEYVAWSSSRIGSYNPSPLLLGERLYVLYDRGIFGCFNALTGEEVYKARLTGGTGQFTTSPWSHDGKIFCSNEYGQTWVLKPGDTFKILHMNELDEMFMASPAIANGALILRGINFLYCVRRQ